MTLSATFVDYAASSWMAKIEAEIYMRTYQYAAEDFRSVKDCKKAHDNVGDWMDSTNDAISTFKDTVSQHTHIDSQGGPTTTPVSAITFIKALDAKKPESTTKAEENQKNNYMVKAQTLSYQDKTSNGTNKEADIYRRSKKIEIAYGVKSLAVKE